MKILFVSTEIWSEKNPEGIVARKIVNGLIENGCSVELLTNKHTNIRGVKETLILEKSNELLSKIRKRIIGVEKKQFVSLAKKFIDNNNIYDLLISRSEPFYLHEIGYYTKLKYPSVKWVASFGDPVFLNPYNSGNIIKRSVAKKLEVKYWKYADLVTHTNQSVIDEYVKNGFPVEKAFVLENPFSLKNNI